MATEWKIWCEIVCCKCASTTSSQFNTVKFHKGKMRTMAMQKCWRIIANDWLCAKCVKEYQNEQ